MVDRKQRDAARRVLLSFIHGEITNDEFEDQFPRSERDAALQGIRANVWMFYSDLKRHKLTGKHEPNAEAKAFLNRCVFFLEADLEFEWPIPTNTLANIPRNLWNRARHWLWGKPDQGDIAVAVSDGDETVYPFFRRSDYEAHTLNPR